MEHPAVTGTFGAGTAGKTLSEAVFAGQVDPGNLVIQREIVPEATTPGTIDTAVFSGPRANYTITQNADGSITVTDGTGTDGTDTLRNIENLRFSDGDVSVAPLATLTAVTNGTFASQQIGTTSATKSFTLTNSGLSALTLAPAKFSLTGPDAASFVLGTPTCGATLGAGASCSVTVSFKPVAPAGPKSATLVATNDSGSVTGSTQTVALTGTATAVPPQQPPTGTPTVTPSTGSIPAGTLLTAANGTLADPNGIASVSFQWQQTTANGTTFANIAGATATTFRVPLLPLLDSRCRSYRVMATVHDNLGKAEAPIASAATVRIGVGAGVACSAPPALAAPAAAAPRLTPLGLATAPPLAPAPLAATALRVTTSTSAPLAVSASVPAGANTVAITLFRLNPVLKRTGRRQPEQRAHRHRVPEDVEGQAVRVPPDREALPAPEAGPLPDPGPRRHLAHGSRAAGEPADHDPEGAVRERPVGPPTRGAEPIGAAGSHG